MRQISRKVARLLRRLLGTQEVLDRLKDIQLCLNKRREDPLSSKVAQVSLLNRYQEMMHLRQPLPRIEDVEFRIFSQNGEDGILLYLFGILGMGARRVVEICAGDGIQCNAANLIINHGWTALLFDGDQSNVERGNAFYASHPDTFSFPPRFLHEWITRENVNQIIAKEGWSGEIDLLSLDIDGVDYWLWDALDTVQPRVVVVEFQSIWSAEHAVTVPYTPQFRAEYIQGFGVYSGASLGAFVKMAARKGYRLVGVQRLGFNAFFVRNGLADDLLPEVEPGVCLDAPFGRWARRELLPLVKDRVWERV